MGDDLNFAQKFTRTAADGLALIAEMDDPRAAGDAAVVVDMMTTLQRGAKRLRARNIYSSAQNVLSALHHEDDLTLSGRINSLGSLVTEYARGLGELLETSEHAPAPPKSHADKWDAARETLNALLPTATPSDADMLSRLMRAPVTIDAVHPQSELSEVETSARDVEIVPFVPAKSEEKTVATPPLEKPAPQASFPNVRAEAETPTTTLDAMMREVIADALSVARSVERTISLSYDMGDRMITEFRAGELRMRLGDALSQIIRQSFNEDRVGHIDINLAGEQLHIMAGTTALRVAIEPENAPAAKPVITPETEKTLRNQLHALMDPSSLHGSAS